jgi:hypothetical protein
MPRTPCFFPFLAILLLAAACAQTSGTRPVETKDPDDRRPSTGITFFGDARLGMVFD